MSFSRNNISSNIRVESTQKIIFEHIGDLSKSLNHDFFFLPYFGALARANVQNDPRHYQKCARKKLFLIQHMFQRDNFMSHVLIYIYGIDVCIGLLYVGVWCAHTVYTELILVLGAKLI